MFEQLRIKQLKFENFTLFVLLNVIQLIVVPNLQSIKNANATVINRFKSDLSLNLPEEQLNLKRQNKVREFCNNYNYNGDKLYNLTNQQMNHLLVNEEHKLLICHIPQVTLARSKLDVHSFNISNRSSEVQQPIDFVSLSELSELEVRKVFTEYTRIIFVRHPFERLAVAYRDLLATPPSNNETLYYQTTIGASIAMNLRGENATESALKYGDDVTFTELIEFLLTPELSKWYFQNLAYDHHFEPIIELCNPCVMDYNVIGKYETLTADLDFTLKKINETLNFLIVEDTEKNVHMNSYFKYLTDNHLRQIYEIYKDDFHLFDYELKNFFNSTN